MNIAETQAPNNYYEKLLETINSSADSSQETIKAEIREVKEEIQEIRNEIQEKHEIFLDKISVQSKQLDLLEQKYSKLDKKYVDFERKFRKNNLIIFGLKAPEDTQSLLYFIINFIKDRLEINISEVEINDIFKFKTNQPNKPAPIKIELLTYIKKQLILKNTHKLKNTKIFIAEDLCIEDREDRKILVQHLKLAKEKKLLTKIRGRKLFIKDKGFTAEQLRKTHINEGDHLKTPPVRVDKEVRLVYSSPSTPSANPNIEVSLELPIIPQKVPIQFSSTTEIRPSNKTPKENNCSDTTTNIKPKDTKTPGKTDSLAKKPKPNFKLRSNRSSSVNK